MKYLIIVPFELNNSGIFAGIREFSTEKIVLLVPSHKISDAEKVKSELARFTVPTKIIILRNHRSFEEFFQTISRIKESHKNTPLMMNLSASKEPLHCIALSSAFVHGIQSFTFENGELFFFPILKFSYYDVLSENKLKILRLLYSKQCCNSLEDLAKKAKLGPSLLNYHIYGNEKNPGLKELGLIEMKRDKGKINISLTSMGKIIMSQRNE